MQPEEYEIMYRVEDQHWWYATLHQLALHHLSASAPEHPLLLDIGCGTGGLMRRCVEDYTAYGLDLAPEALRACRKRGLENTLRGSALALPFPEAHFDAACCLDILYHRQVADPAQALREACRILKPGGVLLLNLPAYEWLHSAHDEAVHTARRFTRKSVRQLVAQTPLELRWMSHWNSLLFPALILIRLLRKARPQRGSDLDTPLDGPLNTVLKTLLAMEQNLLLRQPLPFGLSIFAVLQRPARHTTNPGKDLS